MIHECRYGIFEVYTFLIGELDAVGEKEYRDELITSSRSVEICFRKNKCKKG